MKHQISDLYQMQSLPLDIKIRMTKNRIRDWYNHYGGDVYCSFSGGKDSVVLRDIISKTSGIYDIPSVFCDTGLEATPHNLHLQTKPPSKMLSG